MGILGVFQTSQGQPYVTPLYWTDFATPLQLALVLGAVTGWTYLREYFESR